MTSLSRRSLIGACATVSIAWVVPAFAQGATPSLFKVITVKDEIVIGLTSEELSALGGTDAGAIARALVAKGTLTAWQYAVRKAGSGDLEQAPLKKIGLIAHDSLRVEPYATPLKVLAHE
jgi:hypothetical protein